MVDPKDMSPTELWAYIKPKWVAALKSGEYEQGEGLLCSRSPFDGVTWCCLGVLCDILHKEGLIPEPTFGRHTLAEEAAQYFGTASVLPLQVGELLGIPEYVMVGLSDGCGTLTGLDIQTSGRETLIDMNDSGASFEEIAEAIESELNW